MTKRNDRNFWRHQKADGNVREAKAARDDHMAPISLEVTICVSGITRIISKEAQPAHKGDVDLAHPDGCGRSAALGLVSE